MRIRVSFIRVFRDKWRATEPLVKMDKKKDRYHGLRGGGVELPNEASFHKIVEEVKPFGFVVNATVATSHWAGCE